MGSLFPSYNPGHRRGVASLIPTQVNSERISEMKDKEGRDVLVQGNIITYLNVYAIINIIIRETEGLLICGGILISIYSSTRYLEWESLRNKIFI